MKQITQLDLQRHPFCVKTLGEPDLHFSNIHTAISHIMDADPIGRRGSSIRCKRANVDDVVYYYDEIRRLSSRIMKDSQS